MRTTSSLKSHCLGVLLKLTKKTTAAKRQRRKLTAEFKTKAAFAALGEDKTLAELCRQFEVYVAQIADWKKQLLARATEVFAFGEIPDEPVDLCPLYPKIGQLTLENGFLKPRSPRRDCLAQRNDWMYAQTVHATQTKLLDISRSAVDYQPRPIKEADLVLMRRIDELHCDHRFMRKRMLRRELQKKGFQSKRRHISTLMRLLNIEPLAPKSGTSKARLGHQIYTTHSDIAPSPRPIRPGRSITTYIPMRHGFV